ncbi:putative holin-like toxin [Granulicatella balaenopterae]
MLTVYEALDLMISFCSLIIAILTLVFAIIKTEQKK